MEQQHSIRSVWIWRHAWELIGLSLLAGLGLGLALDRGDLIFVAVFGAVGGMAIIVFREPIVSGVRDPRLA
jgi:hypothetical protein